MAYIESDPAMAVPLPRYESRLAERMIGEADVERLLSVEASVRDRAEFDEQGLNRLRLASINDLPIRESERKYQLAARSSPGRSPRIKRSRFLVGPSFRKRFTAITAHLWERPPRKRLSSHAIRNPPYVNERTNSTYSVLVSPCHAHEAQNPCIIIG
jgi:hypothetical protein